MNNNESFKTNDVQNKQITNLAPNNLEQNNNSQPTLLCHRVPVGGLKVVATFSVILSVLVYIFALFALIFSILGLGDNFAYLPVPFASVAIGVFIDIGAKKTFKRSRANDKLIEKNYHCVYKVGNDKYLFFELFYNSQLVLNKNQIIKVSNSGFLHKGSAVIKYQIDANSKIRKAYIGYTNEFDKFLQDIKLENK